MPRDDSFEQPKRKRPPNEASERLRNLYRSGDETGRTKPDKAGETFHGLKRQKRQSDDE